MRSFTATVSARVPAWARFLAVAMLALACVSCAQKLTLFPDYTEPLQEFTLQGEGQDKVLLVPVRGFIGEEPDKGVFVTRPSTVQEVASQLQKAEKDKDVKAVILVVDSPGGSTTASDIVYHELAQFKAKTGDKVVSCMMGLAASGGYYVSLAADRIVAHPTTITGSVGTIFLQPRISGLMDKIGVEVEAYKSGKEKDMGSPFRPATAEEKKLFQELIDDMNSRFLALVKDRRHLTDEQLAFVADAHVMTASQAKAAGLVDSIGFMQDAIAQAKSLAGLPEDARVVAYRRTAYADDSIYNPATSSVPTGNMKLVDLGAAQAALSMRPGFYWLWLPETR
ncbi:signal peptide peptidase SppA, 36K type [Desulfovibrio sp. X2]|uniref:signal peptide peptidase SppA n=1 Tax=Desulfovibrio sp. X2 TaxID=941449 RepID=UPI000358E08C|nr:signal peptide peptidase SppA [Desulfovibrio sp. X2]EPR37550.1 signal peptide peptidase SppA, 36K type [Desulfovibrio sp. X2]